MLAGSVAEALLLWKLSFFPLAEVLKKAVGLNVNADIRSCLPDYIKVAAKYPVAKPLITGDATTLLQLVKDFRNLIHPGRSERLAKKCDRSTALTAIAGIVAVVNELS